MNLKRRAIKKELKLEELTIKQKLGMTMCAHICPCPNEKRNVEYALQMIKDKALGAVWVDRRSSNLEALMDRIYETAEYPIIIVCDAESGFGDYIVGKHNAVGTTGSEELAYTFGNVTAKGARKAGYNMVCNPLLDICLRNGPCGSTVRTLGSDKYEVARLGAKIAEGMHDAGILTVAKHYPGGSDPQNRGAEIDSHMAERQNYNSKEELIDVNLYPYTELMKKDLLDGIMVGHGKYVNIDPDNPATLSKKVMGIIRELGFDGILITDALSMMGIVAKYGMKESKGLVITAGNDLSLPWHDNDFSYEAILETYEKGLMPDDRIDEAVRRVLEAQHKVNLYNEREYEDITEEDAEKFESIHLKSIFEKCDEGISPSLDPNGKHLFAVLTPMDKCQVDAEGALADDSTEGYWYRPVELMKKIESLFPNSKVIALPEYSSGIQNMNFLEMVPNYDDVVFVTFNAVECYIGKERLTSRTVSLIDALQVTNKVAAVLHYGNPYVLEDLVHVPRILVAGTAPKTAMYAIDVLAGKYEAQGVLTYNVNLK